MVTRAAISMRFSIAGLMGVVVVCGLGFAALRSDSPIWAHATLSVTLLALLSAIWAPRFGVTGPGRSGLGSPFSAGAI